MGEFEDVEYRFADRFTLHQSWGLAAEIVYRHPELTVSRVQGGDKNQLLIVHDGPTGRRIQFDLVAGAQYLDGAGIARSFSWLDVFAQDDPLSAARHLAREAGFVAPDERPPVSGRTLAYRLIARILGLNLDDEHTWQAVAVPTIGDEDDVEAARGVLEQWFPTAAKAADGYVEQMLTAADLGDQYWHEPLWFLLEDHAAVAVLDEAGYAHLPRGRLDLLKIYEASEGDLAGMAALVVHEPTDLFALDVVLGQG